MMNSIVTAPHAHKVSDGYTTVVTTSHGLLRWPMAHGPDVKMKIERNVDHLLVVSFYEDVCFLALCLSLLEEVLRDAYDGCCRLGVSGNGECSAAGGVYDLSNNIIIRNRW